jgi:uncharacterized protein YndB with AHSA1/START domain
MERIEMSVELEAAPEAVYRAWLSSEGHSAMTGSSARFEVEGRGAYTAWEGYISGRVLEAVEGRRILQDWRSSDFGDADGDSLLEVILEPKGLGTRLSLVHSRLPDGSSAEYEKGWLVYYFEPMKAYFSGRAGRG